MAAMAPAPPAPGRSAPEKARFVETYRGRRITGVRYGVGPSGDPCCEMWHVTVDGRPLPLMRRADGSWMTMVDHYQSYPTPLLAARAAVDELGPTARPAAPDGNDGRMDHSGERSEQPRSPKDHVHGVHA
ncbi:tyrosinase cofactor [Streptomyces sp. GbtcB6]|uniref:tyrosinase cofactor n=1 Tax=Streptomyces sp. GbtcB6 TaxID=2824751 RepID=UPI001C30E8CC|nr:tyrosinase cofactor [Streptomyces sp. GbtcB6]